MAKNLTRIDIQLPEGAKAFSTLRDTDTPENPYSGFSICHYTGDSGSHIEECRDRLCLELGVSREALIVPRQTHSANVAVIDRIPTDIMRLNDTDALVTKLHGVVLCINTADCVPVVFYDPVHGVIGAAHSGWRGTVARISVATVEAMCKEGAEPAYIYAAMGPSICVECFEVGEEVAQEFRDNFQDEKITTHHSPRPHIDLPRAIAVSLIKAGIPARQIAYPTECSRCSPDRLFSARHQGVASGRTLTAIYMP